MKRSLLVAGLMACTAARAQSTDGGPSEPQMEVVVMGALEKQLVLSVVTSNRAEVRACYDKALAGFPRLDGKVTVRFVIGAEGGVTSAAIVSASNPDLGRCIAERVKTWVFPKPQSGGEVTVTYPFVLK